MNSLHSWLFIIGAAGLLMTSVAVIASRSPLRSALWLIVSLLLMAFNFVLLDGSFLAAMQVLVYAGAIVVLFTFVVMMLNLGPDAIRRPPEWSVAKLLGVAAVAFVAMSVVTRVLALGGTAGKAIDGSVKSVGRAMLTDYVFGFEAIALVLLVAVVGSVVLGLKRLT